MLDLLLNIEGTHGLEWWSQTRPHTLHAFGLAEMLGFVREGITAITNRVEAFHGFFKWLTFGNAG